MREPISIDNAAKLVELTQVDCEEIKQVAWSPDGTILAATCGTTVRLYVGSFGNQPAHTLASHTGEVTGIAFSPDNASLVSVSADNTVKIWDISVIQITVSEMASIALRKDGISTVNYDPRGKFIATGGDDGALCLWDADSQKLVTEFKGHQKAVSAVTFAIRGNVLASGGKDHTVRLWDATAETEGTIIGTHDDEVWAVCANPPGTMIASSCKDGSVRLWDALSGNQYASLQAHDGGTTCVTFSPYGELMATGGADNKVRVWDVQRLLANKQADPAKAIVVLDGHQQPVTSLDFNPPGTLLASGGQDGEVRLWSIP
jgi:WD40 repeat protein